MWPGKRFGLSAAQKSEVWCRWKAVESLHTIGRAFGKEHSSIRCLVSSHGGFVPAIRRGVIALSWIDLGRAVKQKEKMLGDGKRWQMLVRVGNRRRLVAPDVRVA